MTPQPIKSSRERFLTELFNNFHDELVLRLQRVYGQGPPDPEDIAQSAFAQMAAMGSHEHIKNPKAFLFKVALNNGRRSAGHVAATRAFLDEVLELEGERTEKISPEHLYESRERLKLLNDAMERLTEKQQEILVRSRLLGETYHEIAAQTGWSIATISRQLTSALTELERAEASALQKPVKRRYRQG
ncbi:MAG: sigma-70 family RNA polymerase sigma factor [Pseudomonadota bacterium]